MHQLVKVLIYDVLDLCLARLFRVGEHDVKELVKYGDGGQNLVSGPILESLEH